MLTAGLVTDRLMNSWKDWWIVGEGIWEAVTRALLEQADW